MLEPTESRVLAACVQLTSRGDLGENLASAAKWVAAAGRRGAKLVLLPENFAFLGAHERDKLAVAEVVDADRPGPILAALGAMARSAGAWVIAGGMPERATAEGKVWNSCLVVDASGRLVARYRKVHLFDVNIPGAAVFEESRTVERGNELVVVETPWGGVGLSICYDLRFPELYRALVDRGARIVVVPAAFTAHTGKDHWHPLLRARAIENQLFVLAAAQVGRHHEGRATYGHSLVVDPWGAVLAEAPDREGIVVAELDLGEQERVRRELPCLGHRRGLI